MFQSAPRQEPFVVVPKIQDNKFVLPGFGLSLDYAPMEQNIYGVQNRSLFPTSLDDRDIAKGDVDQPVLTLREKGMVRVMERITDMPDWHKKVFNPEVAETWKKEAMEGPEDISQNMADWIIDELQFKAIIYEHTNVVSLYNGDICKSDHNVPESFRTQLASATKVLDDVPPGLKFYNPGSDHVQRDLVPIAFFPLVYGRTRILKDRIIGLDDALDSMGQGDVIPVPPETITREDMAWRVAARADIDAKPFSRRFQILPCDLELKDDGRWHIISYINNLHPVHHRNIYKLIEDIFNMTVPQWNATLTPLKDMLHSRARLEYKKARYHPVSREVEEQTPQPRPGEAEVEYHDRLDAWRMEHWRAVQPDAGRFIPWAVPPWMMSLLPADLPSPVRIEQGVELNRDYGKRGLQLFVRITSYDLTPERPYNETNWHCEGQMNEHVTATMAYVYHSDNVQVPSLEFRQISETATLTEVEHEPDDTIWLKQVYGLEDGESTAQTVGNIKAPVGRVIIVPATLQHRVNRCELVDKSRPGCVKVLSLFLVDPNIRIISTANVPPQRLDWTFDGVDPQELEGLDQMLQQLTIRFSERKDTLPISLTEARKFHDDVFWERVQFTKYQQVAFESNVVIL
ncbi:hypothetical protein CNMCM8980_002871 [Aspergillus fumigatiaffinis]|uniref:Uncharacterized protein n=1 Tax=Aspergillus fumigatiaffinis TaxID=340414 RepID=A0A8H4HBY0_9EURO|nr:hypothetical protein CNMCM5878_010538 [Aspergillus fumigatiaffinis]KAF4225639.1 hypothetical protein CNMCM6457_007803 [Aspergillus fumigatiaffinis]KAF4241437.1 hypothetical protein CNMCM6805_004095 [Aspergillus fumigatiaffinis]KAF4249765.1 hypothetical protein CNMCM8980_002871 [Aspergillus fumigatiaffinis]